MPNRNELVADHCLKVAGVAAAYIDVDGTIGRAGYRRYRDPARKTFILLQRRR
jgi:hypothetical protein